MSRAGSIRENMYRQKPHILKKGGRWMYWAARSNSLDHRHQMLNEKARLWCQNANHRAYEQALIRTDER